MVRLRRSFAAVVLLTLSFVVRLRVTGLQVDIGPMSVVILFYFGFATVVLLALALVVRLWSSFAAGVLL